MENKEYTSTVIHRETKKKLKDFAKAKGMLLYALLDEIVKKYFKEKEDK